MIVAGMIRPTMIFVAAAFATVSEGNKLKIEIG